MKKVTACLTALAMAGTVTASAVAMTGCKSADLTIMLLANQSESKFYEQYFKELEEKYEISIDFIGEEEENYYTSLSGAMLRDETPDIFYVRPNEILQFKDEIQSVQDYVDAQSAMSNPDVKFDDVFEQALDMYKYNEATGKMDAENGKLYAFPKDLSTQQLGYNRAIVAQYEAEIHAAGLKLPWEMQKEEEIAGTTDTKLVYTQTYTWTEYDKLCRTIANAAKTKGNDHYGCDVPALEIIAKSMGGELMDVSTGTVTIDNANVLKAIEYQANLCTANAGEEPAANVELATYSGFVGGKVAFYGLCGSWEVRDYEQKFGDQWGLMPWPTTTGKIEDWQGMITSAGFVVSKYTSKPELAKEIAASFMTASVQDRLVRREKLSLPITKSVANAYVTTAMDESYSPATRSIYIDVISGEHGFTPVKYMTASNLWLKTLDNELGLMYKAKTLGSADSSLKYYQEVMNIATLKANMQKDYDDNL